MQVGFSRPLGLSSFAVQAQPFKAQKSVSPHHHGGDSVRFSGQSPTQYPLADILSWARSANPVLKGEAATALATAESKDTLIQAFITLAAECPDVLQSAFSKINMPQRQANILEALTSTNDPQHKALGAQLFASVQQDLKVVGECAQSETVEVHELATDVLSQLLAGGHLETFFRFLETVPSGEGTQQAVASAFAQQNDSVKLTLLKAAFQRPQALNFIISVLETMDPVTQCSLLLESAKELGTLSSSLASQVGRLEDANRQLEYRAQSAEASAQSSSDELNSGWYTRKSKWEYDRDNDMTR